MIVERIRGRWREIGLFALLCVAFLIANRGAYRGYFSDDDFDNIAMNRLTGWDTPIHELFGLKLTPVYRPFGAIWQLVTGSLFDMHFVPYVVTIQLMHFVNLALLWLFLRRLGVPLLALFAAGLFYVFHFAAVAAYWQPMYVFDVLCAMMCLTTLVLYQRGHTILAFIAFWLAFKSKELAILLPVALVAYEYWLGQKQWKRVVPFFIVALLFGVQAAYRKRPQDDYSLHFEPSSIVTCINFYLKALTGLPLVAILVFALVVALRSPVAYFGLALTLTLIAPMLLVPGRQNSVYWYVPLMGVAMIVAEAARRWPRAVLASFLLWLPWNNHFLKVYRRVALPAAQNNREYVNQLQYAWAHHHGPRLKTIIIDGHSASMQRWGVDGAIRMVSRDPDPKIYNWGDKEAMAALYEPTTLQLTWNQSKRRLTFGTPAELSKVSYIDMATQSAGAAFGAGWFPQDSHFRWSSTEPEVTLQQNSPRLILQVAPGEEEIRQAGGTVHVQALVDGTDLGSHEIRKNGDQTLAWTVPMGATPERHLKFVISPVYKASNGDPRALGLPVTAVGFVPEQQQQAGPNGAAGTPHSAPGSTVR